MYDEDALYNEAAVVAALTFLRLPKATERDEEALISLLANLSRFIGRDWFEADGITVRLLPNGGWTVEQKP